ncbi:glycosyltransferase family 2 protein [uncultured Pseudokineococcus sp.]|uniref:glycosyltransferase family 2 protein n=1 Tax=uncultured Pseudokineococcus sp. TaxID=1642928 RepID=UPI002612550B|nr:glycosyltransferase [uncultured Pseudokineococcus sp.]
MPDLGPATTDESPDVTVVIPVHGDRGAVVRTLDHLARQRTSRVVEVVVVDNGDNGDLADLLAERPIRVVAEPQKGSYAARNRGISVARGAVLAFTDADCLPRPDWLEGGVTALEANGSGVFVGGHINVVPAVPQRPTLAEVWQLGHDLRQDVYVEDLQWSATASLFVRRADMERVGVFDGSLESSGDKEWGQRASARGLRAVYAPDAVIDHPARRTMSVLLAKRRRIVRGKAALARSRGVPLYRVSAVRSLRPLLRDTWRGSASRMPRTYDRVRLLAITAFVQLYQRGYTTYLRRHTQ